jgi:glycerophosphoryl diester phosphodiesterase
MVQAAGGSVWSPDFRNLGEDALRTAHSLGLRVAVWTVNAPDDIRRMIGKGVDSVISDYPDRVREVAQSFGLPVPEPASIMS